MNDTQNEDQDFDLDDSFDDFGDGAPSEKKGIPKIAIIGGVVLLVIVVIFLFGGSEEEIASSRVGAGNDVQQKVGTEELDQNMVEALETVNEDNRQEAEDTASSFIPIPIAPAQNNLEDTVIESQEVDPLETWKAIQTERIQQEQFQQSIAVAQDNLEEQNRQDAVRQEALNELAKAMSSQMAGIMESKEIDSLEHMHVTSLPDPNLVAQIPQAGGFGSGFSGIETVPQAEDAAVQIIPATTIEYAQTLTEANSDVEGPVLAELVTGPLAGARMLGTFTKEEEYLVIEFNTAVKDGETYRVDAVVLDPETTLPGIATDIDRRWLRRVILPAAAGFIEGLGSAIAETSGTTVSVEGETVTETSEDLDTEEELGLAVEKAAEVIAEIIEDEGADVETQVIVRSGTPIGILFLQPVLKDVSPSSSGAAVSLPEIPSLPGIPAGAENVNAEIQQILADSLPNSNAQ